MLGSSFGTLRLHVRRYQRHARALTYTTAHGDFRTPMFMPVGTSATVKGITTNQLRELGSQVVLANTYHLAMRPGADLVAEAGGIHRFMNYDGPMLTDSAASKCSASPTP